MGKKIFVSYKYADNLVRKIPNIYNTTVRDYVDILQSKIDVSDHINKGEDDGEDMSTLADSTIASKLGDKIFDSTVTIVFISKGMKENTIEDDQWIPWEISYSLKEQSRNYGNSKTNAVLAVVLPDNFGSYEHFIKNNEECGSRTLLTNSLFTILKENMFNVKNPEKRECNGNTIYSGYSSYIYSVKWDDFIVNIDKYIEISVEIWRNRTNYNLRKTV
jgi:energy-converting hydrogenase A subunit M